ncbi:MAG: hypothetical protein MJ113_03805 [Lachnospiraceae bacterium]|nr:hypothetical protein [Lachnospiraceae bacterium]
MAKCKQCNVELKSDEIAIYRKLVNRGATDYLCIPCLSAYFKCSQEIIYERIAKLRESGCTLFK